MLRLRLLIGMCLFVACSSRIRCSHWWTSTRYPLKKIYLWFVRKFPAFLRQFIPSISVSVVTKTHKKKCVSSTNPYSFQISVTKENKKKIAFRFQSIPFAFTNSHIIRTRTYIRHRVNSLPYRENELLEVTWESSLQDTHDSSSV